MLERGLGCKQTGVKVPDLLQCETKMRRRSDPDRHHITQHQTVKRIDNSYHTVA